MCLKYSNNIDDCQLKLKEFVNSSVDYGRIILMDSQKRLILDLNKENKTDNRFLVEMEKMIAEGEGQVSLYLSKKSRPPLFLALLNSLTFSFADFVKDFSVENYFDNYFPRSYNVLVWIVIMSSLLIGYYKYSSKQNQLVEIKEAQFARETNRLKTIKDKKSELQVAYSELREKLQGKSELSKEDIEELLVEYEKSLLSQKEMYEQEIASISELNKVNSSNWSVSYDIKSSHMSDVSFKGNTENSKLSESDHHGKEFIEKVFRSIQEDHLANKLVKTVHSSNIKFDKKGKVELHKHSDRHPTQPRDGFVLEVFCEKHGFCAELQLAPVEQWQAELACEYLVGSKGFFGKGRKFSIKV
jgi:hypothetical protein